LSSRCHVSSTGPAGKRSAVYSLRRGAPGGNSSGVPHVGHWFAGNARSKGLPRYEPQAGNDSRSDWRAAASRRGGDSHGSSGSGSCEQLRAPAVGHRSSIQREACRTEPRSTSWRRFLADGGARGQWQRFVLVSEGRSKIARCRGTQNHDGNLLRWWCVSA